MTLRFPNPSDVSHVTGARPGLCAAGFLCTLGAAVALMAGQALAQNTANVPSAKTQLSKNTSAGTKSGWAELTPAQQAALQPLAPTWGSISEGQKRKWIALSRNFQALSPAERTTLHGRMTEWANLSPLQRSQARLNFAQTNRLSNNEKKAQWEAYQALSQEQKQQLAVGGQLLPSGAAPALKPVDPKKLAKVPVTRSEGATAAQSSPAKPRSTRDAPTPVRSTKGASAPAIQR